jgi:hypothetical protein
MPPPFRNLTREKFRAELFRFRFTRRIVRLHLHHVLAPAGSTEPIEAIFAAQHAADPALDDVAQHVTIAPDGSVWTGRAWNRSPASVRGFNDGTFMIALLGNFDVDPLKGRQRKSLVEVVSRVQLKCGLPADSLHFHNEYNERTTCPGSGLSKARLLAELVRWRKEPPDPDAREPATDQEVKDARDPVIFDAALEVLPDAAEGEPACGPASATA